MTKCPDTSLTEEGRHFAARDGAEEDDGLERCVVTTTTTTPRRCDRRKISRMATFFLVAFGGGVVVGLMVLWNNNDGQSLLPNSPLVSVSYAKPTGGGGEGGACKTSIKGGVTSCYYVLLSSWYTK